MSHSTNTTVVCSALPKGHTQVCACSARQSSLGWHAAPLQKRKKQQSEALSVVPEPCLTLQNEAYVTNWFEPAVAMVSTLAVTVKEKGGCESCDQREILTSCDLVGAG